MAKPERSKQDLENSINDYYGQEDLGTKMLAALESAGVDVNQLTRDDLAPFEELHIRGRESTRVLASMAGIGDGEEVLDVGSGIGGPARTLAAEYECRVTGLDLTRNFILAAEKLTALTGMDDRVSFHQGNALNMPFENDSFDWVWIQHMTMNIEDKESLIREFRRVLRPKGKLAFHEILSSKNGAPFFPVPWANDDAISFLITPGAWRGLLKEHGFKELAWQNDTEKAIAWYKAAFEAAKQGTISLPMEVFKLLVGDDFPQKGQNVLRSMEEDRIKVVFGVYEFLD